MKREQIIARLDKLSEKILYISSVTGENIRRLKETLYNILKNIRSSHIED